MATPKLEDPNFSRTVVLLLEHGEDGALGVVLNRPTPLPLTDALPDWQHLGAAPAVVFAGGPVSADAVIALANGSPGPQDVGRGWVEVVGDVGTVDVGRDPDDVGSGVAAVRVFAGYAGWAHEQLAAEIREHAWFVVGADPRDVFTPRPARLWREVLRRQRAPLSLFASYPDDPNTN